MLGRYFFRRLLVGFFGILLALAVMTWLVQTLALIDTVLGVGGSMWQFFWLSLLTLPRVFSYAIPLALFIAVIWQMVKLLQDSEYFAIIAAGISPWYLLRQLGYLAVPATVCLALLSLYVSPLALRQLRYERDALQAGFVVNALQPGMFRDIAQGVTAFAGGISADGRLQHIVIFDARATPATTYIAHSGYIGESATGTHFVLEAGHIHKSDAGAGLQFGEYILPLAQKRQTERSIASLSAHYLMIHELLDPARYGVAHPYRYDDLRRFGVDLLARLANPIVLSLIAFAVIAGAGAGAQRRGAGGRIFLGILLAVLYQIATSALTRYTAETHTDLYLLAVMPLAMACIILGFIVLRVEPQLIGKRQTL